MILINALCELTEFFEISLKQGKQGNYEYCIHFKPRYENMKAELNTLLTYFEQNGHTAYGDKPNGVLIVYISHIEAEKPNENYNKDFHLVYPNLKTDIIMQKTQNLGEIIAELKHKISHNADEFCELVADDLAHYIVDFKEKHEKTNPKLKELKIEVGQEVIITFLRKASYPKEMVICKLDGEQVYRLMYGGLMWRKWEANTQYVIKNNGKKYRAKRDKIGYYDFTVTEVNT